MKLTKLLVPTGLATIACSVIAPITSCSAKSTWEDSAAKKVRLVLKESTITLDELNFGEIVFDIDRPLSENDLKIEATTEEEVTALWSQSVENHTYKAVFLFDTTKVKSGDELTFEVTSTKYRVIGGKITVTVVYEEPK